jgi:hypothetical protein
VWYCKAECQRLDWAYHKAKCKTKEKRAEEKAAGMALVVASGQGRLSLVRSMLERGADVNFINDDYFTALYVASQEGQLEIVDVLVAAGALVNWARKEDGCTALHMASQDGHPEVVRSLVRAGADVNLAITNEYADSPLIRAAQNGHVQCVDILIEAGAHVNYARVKDGSCYAKYMWEEVFYSPSHNVPFCGPTKKEYKILCAPFNRKLKTLRTDKQRDEFDKNWTKFETLRTVKEKDECLRLIWPEADYRSLLIIQSYDILYRRYKFFDFPFQYLSREQTVLAFLVMGIPYTWNGEDRQGFWFHTAAFRRIKHTEVKKFVEANRQMLV